MVRVIERLLSKPLERRTLTDFDYKTLRRPGPSMFRLVPRSAFSGGIKHR